LAAFAAGLFAGGPNGEIYRNILDALPAAIYATDAAGRITYFNRAAVELAGREPELAATSGA